MIDIELDSLILRNFMSYGNNDTIVSLNFKDPTLIVGRNYDAVVNGQLDSNGSGKTTILNAIAFALYNKVISTELDLNDLINNTNEKNLYVCVTFTKNTNLFYKVERYRKNKVMGGDGVKLCVREDENDDWKDITPSSIDETNIEIARIIGIPFDVFSRIGIFSATHQPFLSLPSSHTSKANQKDIIEELFGITELSEKAELLKKEIKDNKKLFETLEEINTTLKRERNNHVNLLESVRVERDEWVGQNALAITALREQINTLSEIDTDEQIKLFESIKTAETKNAAYASDLRTYRNDVGRLTSDISKAKSWGTVRLNRILSAQRKLEPLVQLDIAAHEESFAQLAECQNTLKVAQDAINSDNAKLSQLSEKIKKLDDEAKHLGDSNCPYCKQSYAESAVRLDTIELELMELNNTVATLKSNIETATTVAGHSTEQIAKLKSKAGFATVHEMRAYAREYEVANKELADAEASTNPYNLEELEAELTDASDAVAVLESNIKKVSNRIDKITPLLLFANEREAITAGGRLDDLRERLKTLSTATNPHDKTYNRLVNTTFEDLKDDEINELDSLLEHQNFMLKLLTKKDSFVRKVLIQKNLPFLNGRLKLRLDRLGLPHRVMFAEDLSVKISQFGKVTKFGGMSSGQRARINLALSFAFRDVLQKRHGKLNFCILDECLDTGLGTVGVQLAAEMIKGIAIEDKLSMFVISHKDEIASMFNKKLEVELRNGFSTIVEE